MKLTVYDSWIKIIQDVKHLYAPRLCKGCDIQEPLGEESYLCLFCTSELPHINDPTEAGIALKGKLNWDEHDARIYSLYYFTKSGVVQQLIHKIKYHSDRTLAFELGRLLGKKMAKYADIEYQVLPIPLHSRRLRMRGYNQAEEISRGIISVCGNYELSTRSLLRVDSGESQTKRAKAGRKEYLAGAFALGHPLESDRPILLVDDVLTTGATLSTCINLLKDTHKGEIDVATLAISI